MIFPKLNTLNALELCRIATEFDLVTLEREACRIMERSFTINNFYSYFEFADENDLRYLKSRVIKFIRDNLSDIINSTNWRKLDLDLRFDLLEEYAETQEYQKLSEKESSQEVAAPSIFSIILDRIEDEYLFWFNIEEWLNRYQVGKSLIGPDNTLLACPRGCFTQTVKIPSISIILLHVGARLPGNNKTAL